jgi:hypothetical protein
MNFAEPSGSVIQRPQNKNLPLSADQALRRKYRTFQEILAVLGHWYRSNTMVFDTTY